MKKQKTPVIRIYNNSNQLIQLQLRSPGGDFFTSETQVRINPGKDVLVPKSHIREDQVSNLAKRGLIKIVHDSEIIDEHENSLVN